MADEEACKEKEWITQELTAKQRKNKKKKEASKVKKQEQREKESNVSHSAEDNQSETEQVIKEKFNDELSWCIEQLEIGLLQQKPDKKTEEFVEDKKSLISIEALKTIRLVNTDISIEAEKQDGGLTHDCMMAMQTEQHIRSLKSPKTALPKKRQMMFSAFGDYRKKMQDDMKTRYQKERKPIKVFAVRKQKQRSVFLKVSQSSKEKAENASTSETENGQELKAALSPETSTWRLQPSGSSFTFNFEDPT